MSTVRIFEHPIGTATYEVWVTNGVVQYVINNEIQHGITSVGQFLEVAAKAINKPNSSDAVIIERSGSISDNALENFQDGSVTFLGDTTSPSITLQDEGTEVKIGGAGVGGEFRVDFGTGTGAQTEAQAFIAFANDLLGKATATELENVTGVQIGDFTRTVTVSTRDDDITKIAFKSSGDARDVGWADLFVDQLATSFGGVQTVNGNVSEAVYEARQIKILEGGLAVDLGPHGVGGKEVWEFDTTDDATAFFNAMKGAFGAGADKSSMLDSVIEQLAEDLGGTILSDGNVSQSYQARQIKLVGNEGGIVDLGSHGVGGRERYDFGDERTALEFIDTVRDIVGVEATEGPRIDEFIFKVSGGAGIQGSPTFVGKDAFIEFIGEEFGGTLKVDGAISEGFGGGGRIVGDGTEVQLGPRGVGGKEIWDFDDAEAANAFLDTVNDFFG